MWSAAILLSIIFVNVAYIYIEDISLFVVNMFTVLDGDDIYIEDISLFVPCVLCWL